MRCLALNKQKADTKGGEDTVHKCEGYDLVRIFKERFVLRIAYTFT